MKRPKSINDCPAWCKGHIMLKREHRTFTKKNGDVLTGDWWFYECEDCGERFTTTESDEISLNNLKTVLKIKK